MIPSNSTFPSNSNQTSANLPSANLPVNTPIPGGADPLAELKDIIQPESAIGFWPPAPGWWILGVALIIVVFFLVYLLIKHIRHNQYRKQSLQLLDNLSTDTSISNSDFLCDINRILKRTCLTAYPRLSTASLVNEKWIDFLLLSSPKIKLNSEAKRFWVNNIYAVPSDHADMDGTDLNNQESKAASNRKDVLTFAKKWIKTHKSESIIRINIRSSAAVGAQS